MAPVRAEDKKTEAAARAALQKAQAEFTAATYDPAIARLRKAIGACAPNRCSNATRATLQRDLGSIWLAQGDEDGAMTAFAESLKIDPRGQPNPVYDSPDLGPSWAAAKEEAEVAKAKQPSGDFTHTPAAEQTVRTPLPIYVEIVGSTPFVKAFVKYKGSGASEYTQLPLAKVGKGWGALIPCSAVTRGVMRYYLVGIDSSGTPAAASGGTKHPFFVRIRPTIASEAPSLPGQPPPKACGEKKKPCEAGQPGCDASPEPAPPPDEAKAAPTDRTAYSRLWVGLAGSIDFVPLPSATDACKLDASGRPAGSNGYYCTEAGGSDFPTRAGTAQNAGLAPNNGGNPAGGFGSGNVRVMLTLDYAVSPNLLVGGRVGFLFNRYGGHAASNDGRMFSIPVHVEARGTYVFGRDALTESGLAAYGYAAAGVSEFEGSVTVSVKQTGIAGLKPVDAWKVGGPGFVALGGGARFALSPRAATTTGIKLTAAVGPSGVLPILSPEVAFQYGF